MMNHIRTIGFTVTTLCIIALLVVGICAATIPGGVTKKMTIEDTLSDEGQRTTIAGW